MTFNQKKSLGIALGGGGARALFHIGLMNILQKENIKVSAISGTSMGAIVGALYALGIPPTTLLESVKKKVPKKVVSLSQLNIHRESLLKPENFESILEETFGNKTFSDCQIPFNCMAVDIESGEAVVLDKGLIRKALRASASIPTLLPPVLLEDKVLVDGGILDNVPLMALRKNKFDIAFAVKINSFSTKQRLSAAIFKKFYAPENKAIQQKTGVFGSIKDHFNFMSAVTIRTLEIATAVSTNIRINDGRPDLLIAPDITSGLLEFSKADETIAYGEKLMQENLETLKKLIS